MTIRLEGYDDLLKRITTLAQLKQLQAAVKSAALHVKGKIATYPAVRRGPAIPPARSWTARQRRGFFAKLRKGEIEVPYRRGASPGSQTLGRKWHVTMGGIGGLMATVGNNVSYGPLVQAQDSQTMYHATTGWKTTERVAEEERTLVISLIADELQKAANG